MAANKKSGAKDKARHASKASTKQRSSKKETIEAKRLLPKKNAQFSVLKRPPVDISALINNVHHLRPGFRVPLRRPADLLVFDLVFYNLKLASDQPPRLVRHNATQPAYMVVEFPPQSFSERVFVDATGPEGTDNSKGLNYKDTRSSGPGRNVPTPNGEPLKLPAQIRMSGKSRVAFTVPADPAEIPFTLNAVLTGMRTWPMHLDAIAAPEPAPIFLPGRLAGKEWLRSVTKSADWAATAQVVKSAMESSTSPKITGVLKAAGVRVGEAAVET